MKKGLEDVVELLLAKRAELETEKADAINEAIFKVEEDFKEREEAINKMLYDDCGYENEKEEPVSEDPTTEEIEAIECNTEAVEDTESTNEEEV